MSLKGLRQGLSVGSWKPFFKTMKERFWGINPLSELKRQWKKEKKRAKYLKSLEDFVIRLFNNAKNL